MILGTAPSSSNVLACTLLGSTRIFMPFMIGGGADRPDAIRDVAEAVLEVAEDPVIHPRFDSGRQHLTEAPVHGAASLSRVGKEERQVGGSEVEHAIGQVAARLIPERQHALLDQPENVLAAIAEVQDVVDVLDFDRVAERWLRADRRSA